MNRTPIISACLLLLLPGAALAATRTYETGAFDAVSAAAGVDVEITLGATRSVVAETRSDDFDDLRITVQGNVLKIERAKSSWFAFRRPNYTVRVVTPVLRAVEGSSGSDVSVKGTISGDFSAAASSGSDVEIEQVRGGSVSAQASSGSDLSIAGTCTTLAASASSGSDVDAGGLHCETVAVQASSGSDVDVFASRSVTGSASSGSDIHVGGAPPAVQVDKSSGADVTVGR